MPRQGSAPAASRPVMGVLAFVLAGLCVAMPAWADISGDVEADSVQDGDNRFTGSQDNSTASGDASAGSNIVGSAGQGDTTIDVTNRSDGADAETGDVELTSDLSNAHVGEKTSAVETEPPAAPAEEVVGEPIGPLGPLGPSQAPDETWWGTDVIPAGEPPSTNALEAGNPDGSALVAATGPEETVEAAAFGSAGPLAMGAETAVLSAAGEGDPLGQVTGPPGPTGPAGPLDLDSGGQQNPAQVVPTPRPSTPAPATRSPDSNTESEGDALPVNGAYIQTFATIATVLTAVGFLLSTLSRLARLRRLAADLIAP